MANRRAIYMPERSIFEGLEAEVLGDDLEAEDGEPTAESTLVVSKNGLNVLTRRSLRATASSSSALTGALDGSS
jgi:hypothetical protein